MFNGRIEFQVVASNNCDSSMRKSFSMTKSKGQMSVLCRGAISLSWFPYILQSIEIGGLMPNACQYQVLRSTDKTLSLLNGHDFRTGSVNVQTKLSYVHGCH